MIRLGLCCVFAHAPIRFRRATATAMQRYSPAARRRKLAELCRHNAESLRRAIEYCAQHGIGDFRVNSQILPLASHPKLGYELQDLPDGSSLIRAFKACGKLARSCDIRLTFHPDQFVVLNSPRPEVVESSVRELVHQARVAEWIGADVINLHGGGAYGDSAASLSRLRAVVERLPAPVRRRLTLENDDRVFSPADLIPVCRETGVPLCYDVHHHRCRPDGWSVERATEEALSTWKREPLFHVSSPLGGWRCPAPQRHHDFINVRDFPRAWESLSLTVEVEAKAKERAIENLAENLRRRGVAIRMPRWPAKGEKA